MMREHTENKTSSTFLKTDGGKTQSNAIEAPTISLPKGGGAIKGIDEKFSVNAVNGTAGFSIQFPFSSTRGITPSLNLSYNSGAGNGIFGLGWNINLGSIKRKTEKGLPQYMDTIDSDVFIFSEAEDLVPEFKKEIDGTFTKDLEGDYVIKERESVDGLFTIRNYRPRIEGLFYKIERWTEKTNGIIKWRVITKDNVTTLFGWTNVSTIADPQNKSKIFEWRPEFTFDDKGNCYHYIYKKEDKTGFEEKSLHNRNRLRNGEIMYTNLYIDKIMYGNKTPYKQFGDAFPEAKDYLFKTVFDYGNTDYNTQPIDQLNYWWYRADAFSDYKAGFEIRTTRLCRRVIFYHHFKGINEYDGIVRSINFEYDTDNEQDFTFLKAINTFGYIKKSDGTYSYKKIPSIEFEYQKHDWDNKVRTVSSEALINAPVGIEQNQYQFVDLFNEGLSGILSEQANGWYYKHNLGVWKNIDKTELMFEQAKLISPKPSFSGISVQLQLCDLDGDGGKQLVNYETEPRGYFELDDDNEWQSMRNFKTLPNINFGDPNTRMLDLNGDGKLDVMISDEQVFTWYASEGRDGYAAPCKIEKSFDEEKGPHIIFADTNQTIYLADMTGDGLTDIVRIRNGDICFWPNLGYGKFGAKVSMDNAPLFDHPDAFNPTYIRLADIDGSGTSDIIYLGKNKFSCWKNLSGNRFSSVSYEINSFPELHSESKVTVTDLLGNGVACIVWSSPLSKDAQAPLKYIDLMNSKKPHIMVSYKNNLGKEVKLEYTPSTKYYIEDKLAGKPWATKLHFPVHCISRTITEDKISGYKFISEYKYHHGYYDHYEREFRGFGMVEQTDTETFEHWVKQNATNITEADLHQEPVVSRSWHHTGAFLRNDKILGQYEKDYWYHEYERQFGTAVHPEVPLTDARIISSDGTDPGLIDLLNADEIREAFRACKGMALRAESFALDAKKCGNSIEARKKELTPFSVATHNCVIELLQPRGRNKHAVFAVKESEAITYNYDRNFEDARISHALNIKIDEYGNVLESASVIYPRAEAKILSESLLPAETRDQQRKTVIIYTRNRFTNDVTGNNTHRLKLPCEIETFELRGVSKTGTYYAIADFTNILESSNTDAVFYHEINKTITGGKAQKRLIEHIRTLYYKNDLSGPLPLGQLESLAFSYEGYQLAYTPELVADIFGTKVNDSILNEGKFKDFDGNNNWWIRSGTIQYKSSSETQSNAQSRFYVPFSYTDPYGAVTRVKYYETYFLFIKETEDILGNKTSVEHFNFRTLSPTSMRDINGNLSAVISDELGLIKAMAIEGKDTDADGIGNQADDLVGLTEVTDPSESTNIIDFFKAPDSTELTSIGKILLKHASTRYIYDLDQYNKVEDENKQHLANGEPQKVKPLPPAVIASITRETHYRMPDGNPDPQESKVQIAFEYSNGMGEVVMKKVQAEPGKAKQVVVHADNTYSVTTADTTQLNPKQLRWIGNGRNIKNNKGNAVKQYEPYFSVTWKYEDFKELVESGVTPKMFYDAAGRLVKTEMPDGTFSKVEFASWKQALYDANDNVIESEWYITRKALPVSDPERKAAEKAELHANTPTVLHFDTLGRPVLSIDHNKNIGSGADEFYLTRIDLDIEGNLRSVTDARGNTVMQYKYDMLGNLVYQNSMDAGQRWLMTNILGKPLRTWDERGHTFLYFYDIAQRPTHSKVLGGDGTTSLDHIFDRVIYGESLLTGSRTDADRFNESALQHDNLLGKPIRHYDTGGVIETTEFDFKGQPVFTTRKLFKKYKKVANWIDSNLSSDLEVEEFTFTTETDALGRITKQTTPDKSVITPAYNATGLLKAEKVSLFNFKSGMLDAGTDYIKYIDYNEKGQRNKIIYGNDVTTKFTYDDKNFRLRRLETVPKNPSPVNSDKGCEQDWYYTFDAVGNITQIEDKKIPVVFFDNQKTTGISEYTYDALYRLRLATGRENHVALSFNNKDNSNDASFINQLNAGDPMSMRNYSQKYSYDDVGNITQMKHEAMDNNWTRNYTYEAFNNRLTKTEVGTETFSYAHHAQHGYMLTMPHLEDLGWNFKEELVMSIRQKVSPGNGTAETTYYQYDGSGQRIRKITENQAAAGNNPTRKEERIYLAGYETYKMYEADAVNFERISLSLMDQGHRFVMVERVKQNKAGAPAAPNRVGDSLIRYQLHNHLGSAALELDESARVISYEEYHPFGTTAYQANNKAIKAAAKRYRYTGMERDEETGLEYHSARYYLPWLGRWLNADPIGINAGVNLYSYVINNPIIQLDSSGTDGETCGVWDEESMTCYAEQCPIRSNPDAEVPPSSTPPNVRIRRRPAPTPPAPEQSRGMVIEPAPPVSPTDYTLHIPQGFAYTQYQTADREWQNPDNPIWARVTFLTLGVLAAPYALAEEYVSRPILNVPFVMHNAGKGIGEHTGRAVFWADQGEYAEAALEGLHVMRDTSFGIVAGLSVAAPVAGALESRATMVATRAEVQIASEETVSVYHGSWNNAPTIRASGLDASRVTGPNGGATYVTTDLRAATNAIEGRYEYQFLTTAERAQTGVIESRIPMSEFSQLPTPRPYPGFSGSNLQSSEILLSTEEHILLFNRFIVR